jgi:hypothetical protein
MTVTCRQLPSPAARARRVARAVGDAILTRMSSGQSPVDLAWLRAPVPARGGEPWRRRGVSPGGPLLAPTVVVF